MDVSFDALYEKLGREEAVERRGVADAGQDSKTAWEKISEAGEVVRFQLKCMPRSLTQAY